MQILTIVLTSLILTACNGQNGGTNTLATSSYMIDKSAITSSKSEKKYTSKESKKIDAPSKESKEIEAPRKEKKSKELPEDNRMCFEDIDYKSFQYQFNTTGKKENIFLSTHIKQFANLVHRDCDIKIYHHQGGQKKLHKKVKLNLKSYSLNRDLANFHGFIDQEKFEGESDRGNLSYSHFERENSDDKIKVENDQSYLVDIQCSPKDCLNEAEKVEQVVSCDEIHNKYLAMSNKQLFDLAVKKQIGKCYVDDRQLLSGFCDFYAKAAVKGTDGDLGWPKNPSHGGGTGCVMSPNTGKGVDICWNGNTAKMCTQDGVQNAGEQIRDALKNKVCGLCE